MKIAVLIPCTERHARHLEGLLTALNQNCTRAPDQIAVSCNDPEAELETLKEGLTARFPNLSVHLHRDHCNSAMNRNIAADLLKTDIDLVMYQDADDQPHPRRHEIIEGVFERYPEVQLVCHSYRMGDEPDEPLDLSQVAMHMAPDLYRHYFPNGDFEECRDITDAFGSPFMRTAAGPVCLRRAVLDSIRWNEKLSWAVDYDFNMRALYELSATYLVDLKLYVYNK